jgi:mRNA interferase RelE/StbE
MYTVTFKESALKELKKIQQQYQISIVAKIEELEQNPRPLGCKKLKAQSETLYRIKSGDYRIIYKIEDQIKIVNIRKIGNRKDVYK